eukprot:1039564-Alexandrium_andersonii.AAC.1
MVACNRKAEAHYRSNSRETQLAACNSQSQGHASSSGCTTQGHAAHPINAARYRESAAATGERPHG